VPSVAVSMKRAVTVGSSRLRGCQPGRGRGQSQASLVVAWRGRTDALGTPLPPRISQFSDSGDGGVFEKSPEMSQFLVFPYPQEAELTPSGAAGGAQDGKMKKNGSHGGYWKYNGESQKARTETLV